MHEHLSLHRLLAALVAPEVAPVFEASDDPTLLAFARLVAATDLVTFDANKHLRTGALSPIYDCMTESRRAGGAGPDRFVAIWTPVWPSADPVTGFRVGRDSVALGSTPTVAMPPDERTAALLLLVTSTFVHLSASRAGPGLLVQGAVEAEHNGYRFLTLGPSASEPVGRPTGRPVGARERTQYRTTSAPTRERQR